MTFNLRVGMAATNLYEEEITECQSKDGYHTRYKAWQEVWIVPQKIVVEKVGVLCGRI